MKTTLLDRANAYFGEGNLRNMRAIRQGRWRLLFVSPRRLAIYDETEGRPSGQWVPLTAIHAAGLIDALEGF